MQTTKKAARSSCNYPTPNSRALVKQDLYSVADFDVASHHAGIIIGLAFGLMFFIGVMCGW